MTTKDRMSALSGRKLLMVMLVLGLLVAIVGCGSFARASRTSGGSDQDFERPVQASSSCRNPDNGPPVIPKGQLLKGQPILAGPIIVGCGKRLGEPIQFMAYVQATTQHGEQLCYVLEQPRQKAAIGGSCLTTAPSLPRCTAGCPLTITEATIGGRSGRQASKASLITGAAPGAMEEVVLSTRPLRNDKATPPFIVVLEGSVRERLRLSGAVSLFASFVTPCVPARQVVYAKGAIVGAGDFVMQGTDPFSCNGGGSK